MTIYNNKLSAGAGISSKKLIFSIGISFSYWKCTKTICARLHFAKWKLYLWKSFLHNADAKTISELIEQ